MAVQRLGKGAHRKGAPFAFLRVLLLLVIVAAVSPLAACPLDKAGEKVSVSAVFDGDTVKLKDGRKVRFAGINTPEINHEGGSSEPYAQAARQRLVALMGGDGLVLRYAAEREDHYGRLLAHPYLPDGRSVSAILLREGLAAVVAIPPSLWQNECYRASEREARDAGRGIWMQQDSFVHESRALARGDEGFALLRGRVEEVDESRNSLWLELTGNAALRIPKRDLHYFDELEPRNLSGRHVEARGWLTYYRGKWRMNVRHPRALELLAR